MRVNIWIPDLQLKKINDYCIENDIPRSKLLTKAALNSIGVLVKKSPKQEKSVYTHNGNTCEHGRMKGLCEYGCT